MSQSREFQLICWRIVANKFKLNSPNKHSNECPSKINVLLLIRPKYKEGSGKTSLFFFDWICNKVFYIADLWNKLIDFDKKSNVSSKKSTPKMTKFKRSLQSWIYFRKQRYIRVHRVIIIYYIKWYYYMLIQIRPAAAASLKITIQFWSICNLF